MPRIAVLILLSAFCAGHCLIHSVVAADPELKREDLPRFPAVPPDAALGTFQIRPGFHLETAASEPQVVDPVALAFDASGRIYVVEMRDYSERRPELLGRIRILEDRDHDGRFETSRIFLEDLPWPTAITCWDGGVFIGATPDVIYARDTDNDGRADLRETIFTGFASDSAPYATNQLNVQAMLNSFHWGIDCRIHGATSLSGGKVRLADNTFTRAWREAGLKKRHAHSTGRAKTPNASDDLPVIELRGRDFSFDPLTLELRAESGGGQHGMSFDDVGNKFVCSNSDHLQHVRYEDRYLQQKTWHPLPHPRVSIAVDGPAAEVYRISPEEPWRIVRTRWRVTGLANGPVEGGGRASGYFTGATGVTLFRGDAYGEDCRGDAFIADCGSNLIHRKRLRVEGCDWFGERPEDERNREFIGSEDTWFRPVQFANAPDGCLWVLDMYREIIEHPWSLPSNLKRWLDLNSGNDRGRLYRIVSDSASPRRRVDLTALSTSECVGNLGHPNGWHRDTASRLLLERQAPETVELLRRTLTEAKKPLARLHATYLLWSLGSLTGADLQSCLNDPFPDLRRHGVRLAELMYAGPGELSPSLMKAMRAMVEDTAPIRLQLALSLSMVRGPGRLEILEQLVNTASGRPHEGLIMDAALAAIGDEALTVFKKVWVRADFERWVQSAGELAAMVGRRNQSNEVSTVIALLSEHRHGMHDITVAADLAKGLKEAGSSLTKVSWQDQLAGLFSDARRLLANGPASLATTEKQSLDALRLVVEQAASENSEILLRILEGNYPTPFTECALDGWMRGGDAAVSALLQTWSRMGGTARREFLDRVLRRPTGAALVLDSFDQRLLRPNELTPAQANLLRGHRDAALRSRAEEWLGSTAPSRSEAISAALPALDLQGDSRNGLAVYQAQCAQCHRLGGQGNAVGPDMESVRSQPKEKLLLAILDPSREVAANFAACTIETTDDESITGLLINETTEAVTLRVAGGTDVRIVRGRLRSLKPEGRSLMPDGFEATMTRRQLADLLACLTGEPLRSDKNSNP